MINNVQRSWQTGNELADNKYFWQSFGYKLDKVLIENTDGLVNGVLFEFKPTIPNLTKVLSQAIVYLSKMRNKGGIPIPSKIVLIDMVDCKN
ncbi:hypothetical protein [Leuconostoc suionicum]|uniref:hypothetical protein n=1 Tax=Leuconostoc suionicum TaxID=1511761 RepID=UPI0021A7C82F|nr:hypothetical protein [Leuconostoc suionicum]MCT4377310.1 hypothetical protein [Leuconostoc suionicum]